ncbi:DUF4892 domain-containing protein [Pseudomonas duriflava]|nr:DUF4892 domain-containing protein [Pseudomonas duriflava]
MRMIMLSLTCLLAIKAGAADFPGSADLEALPRPAHANIVDYHMDPSVERSYPQGSVSRIGGRLRLEGEVQAQGHLTALTYEMAQGHNPVEALDKARHDLQQQSAIPLFWCEGRDCGSSNVIANAIFGKSRLYGPDGQQAYLLLRLAAPQENTLLVLYAITRGNRRGYLHVEQLNATSPLGEQVANPSTLLRQLRRDGELHLPMLETKPDAVWTDLLSRVLAMDGDLAVVIGGPQAEKWRDALVERRIRIARLQVDAARPAGLYVKP